MNILELSEKRFSARKYTAEPVAQSDLDYIMECVRLAPSAVNKQPWKFVIVRSEEAKQKLREFQHAAGIPDGTAKGYRGGRGYAA